MDKERFEQAIRKAIADRNAQSPEQRLRIYDAARAALARRPAGSPVLSETLEAAIEQIESSFAPKSTPEAAAAAEAGLPGSNRRPAARPVLTRSLPAFVGGAVLGAALAALGFILLNQPAGQSADVRSKLEARYAKALGQLPAAEEFLGTITNAIVEVDLVTPSDFVMTIVAEMTTLIPGSVVIEARRSTHSLFLHVIDVRSEADVEAFKARVLAQEQRVLRAFGSAGVVSETNSKEVAS